jgi:hypothetical protein
LYSIDANDDEQQAAPIIEGFSPASGQRGTTVTIHGKNLGGASAIVQFNGSNAVCSGNDTQLVTTVPSDATTGPVTIMVKDLSVTSEANFTVILPPVIASFSPSQGPVGSSVTITGENFSAGCVVKFNNTIATVNSATVDELLVTVPIGATTGKISVKANDFVVTSDDDFTILPPPVITSFSPHSGPPGSTVIIVGSNFDPAPTSNTVKFNGVAASINSATSNSLSVTVPANSTTGKITVTTNGVTVSTVDDYVVEEMAPGVISFSPERGVAGESVTITGVNFSETAGANSVKFNGITATVTSASTTSLVVTVPATATTGKVFSDRKCTDVYEPK